MSMATRTTTSYAILGLLAIRPFTTYEIAQQMERSLRYLWPRTRSRVYQEPKRLVADGLAVSTRDHVGRRPRTTYAITDEGRRVLGEWLATPGGGPSLEFEALLKVFYGEQTSKAAVLANVAAARTWAVLQNERNVSAARDYLETGGPFPGREGPVVLIGGFITQLTDMVMAWSDWAQREVESWPDDGSAPAPDREVLAEIAARLTSAGDGSAATDGTGDGTGDKAT